VTGKRIFTVRPEEFCEFLALLGAEARTNPDMLQRTGLIEKAQQQ
jgi:hypothetical protein